MGFAVKRRLERLMTPTGRHTLRLGPREVEALGSLPEGFLFARGQARLPPKLFAWRRLPMTSLNPSQRQSVLFGFIDVHRRMAEFEAFITQSTTSSAFSQYVGDLSPTESRVVQDYFARIRSTMLACLQEAGIPLEVRHTSLRWTLQVGMTFLHIAIAEMAPERLRGYGPLDSADAKTIIKIQQDLYRLIDRVSAYLRQGLGQDMQQRLDRLEATPASVTTLTVLEKVISRWQLVEFRPLLDTIIRRLEAPQFEIAVFGRVSSGKSSLLNHVAGMDVLPVGVTPITAVPTRLVRGEEPAAIISFADIEPRRIDVGQLRDYASEEGNPGNHKHVTNILVQMPSPRLREGVVLVDTPGIGSLALAGSAETFAYLPRCDLGVVLIDASSTLNQEDLGILRALYEAGTPAQVLLSKADLLTSADRQRMVSYIQEQLRRELGLSLPVHPVSTVGADEALLLRWFEQAIAPLLDEHRALTEASLRRKLGHLRESVVAVLQTLLARQQGGKSGGRAVTQAAEARKLLEEADSAVRQAKARCQDWTADEPALVEVVLQDAAQAVVAPAPRPGTAEAEQIQGVVRQVLTERGRMAHQLVKDLQQVLSRTLEGLRQTAPLAEADAGSVRDLVFSGMPVLDLSPLRERCHGHRLWWASLLPRVAVWSVRRSLRRQVEPAIREYVGLYDRHLRAWLRSCIAQLAELYESQAEVFREQVRRLTVEVDGADQATDSHQLLADVKELQGTDVGEKATVLADVAAVTAK
jgi:GTP-binding protein EngB required for normal cell division